MLVFMYLQFWIYIYLVSNFSLITDSSNENSTSGSNTSKVGQSIMGSKKAVAKPEELYSDKNIKITRTGGNIIIDNLTDKEINIESTFVINNSIEGNLVRHNLVLIRKESSQYLYQNLLQLIQDRKLGNQTKKQKMQTTIGIK